MPRPYKPRGDRKIQESKTGRVLWRPGKPHPLDILFEEAATLRKELPGHVEELLSLAQHVQHELVTLLDLEQQFADPAAPLSAADSAAIHAVSERFSNRKHLGHLEAVFAVLRRKRLAGRLQAIRAALDLASGLLGGFCISPETSTPFRGDMQKPPISCILALEKGRSTHGSENGT